MISDLARLAYQRDRLDKEIEALCSRLGQLTQERYVITVAIRELSNEKVLTYEQNKLPL